VLRIDLLVEHAGVPPVQRRQAIPARVVFLSQSYLALVLPDAAGKEQLMGGPVEDEEQVVGTGRMLHRRQRLLAEEGNRSGWQALVPVGVVGRVQLEVLPRQEGPMVSQRVFQGRTGAKLHVMGKPVEEHRGNQPVTLSAGRFLLDDAGQYEELVRAQTVLRSHPPVCGPCEKGGDQRHRVAVPVALQALIC